MAFTRFSSDPDIIQKRLVESTFNGVYNMNVPGNGLNNSYIDDTHIRLQKWGGNLRTNTLDIENDLRGTNRKLGSDYQNYLKTSALSTSSAKSFPTKSFSTDETRASCPAWLFRDLQQYTPNYLQLNPQSNVAMSFENNQATRNLEKDYYLKK
jgi:hypothetical protein